jgi:diguanylate cyclase (GGDEF)-like protein/PAS domain S-box-containing protein
MVVTVNLKPIVQMHTQDKFNNIDFLSRLAQNFNGVIYQLCVDHVGNMSFVYISPSIYDFCELTAKQLQQDAKALLNVVHADDISNLIDSYRLSALNLNPWLCNFRVLKAVSEHRLSNYATAEKLADGSVLWTGQLSVIPNAETVSNPAQDIATNFSNKAPIQKQMPLVAPSLAGEHFYQLYEYAPIAYLSVNQDHVVLEANLIARTCLGIQVNQLAKVKFSSFLRLDSKRRWKKQLSLGHQLQDGDSFELELKLVSNASNAELDIKLFANLTTVSATQFVVRMTLLDVSELKKNESYQRTVLNCLPYITWLKDENGILLTANNAYVSATGKPGLDQIVGKSGLDFWSTELAKAYMGDDDDVLNSGMAKTVEQALVVDGQQKWFEAYKSPVKLEGRVIGTVGFARDITERKKALSYEQLKNEMLEMVVREENLQTMLDRINQGIELLNPKMACLIALTDKEGETLNIVSAPSLPEVFVDAEQGAAVAIGSSCIAAAAFVKQRVIVDDIASHPYCEKNRDIALALGLASAWLQPIIDSKDKVLGVFAIMQRTPQLPDDIDIMLMEQFAHLISIALERKAADKKIAYLAYYDDLTGLPNRRYLYEQLKRTLSMVDESAMKGALLYIDIDQFKSINETRGHDIGDLLLKEVANRLQSGLSVADLVSRASGDEFIVLLENLQERDVSVAKQAEIVADRLLKEFTLPFKVLDETHYISASIGIALFGERKTDVEETLKQADIAMFQAKHAGRNTFRFFDPEVQKNITALVGLEAELRDAILLDQLQLYYQVQVDHLGQPFGVEALIRWNHPTRGLIPPVQFIPLAESSGLIVPLGYWVLNAACAQLKAWQANAKTRELTMSVNISAKQLKQSNFVAEVTALIEQYKIDPANLRMELTESMLLDNVEQIVEYMNVLGEIGVQFSLDDFGTGYSSLQYLKRLPLYQLKIDQSFVRDIVTNSHDRTIVRTIIAMAQSMYIGVIAEGVETKEQHELLLTNGCRRCQGYYFGRPVPLDEFEKAFNFE